MKNINVKKIVAGAAALGVGALMISGAMAANVTPADWTQVTKEDLFNEGVPAVSIVVGNNAQPIDVVWAGNIAAAIGKNAHTVIEGSEGGYLFNNVIVEVGTKSTTSEYDDGKLYDTESVQIDESMGANSFNESLDHGDFEGLYDDSIENDIEADSSYDLDITEKIVIKGDLLYSTDDDIEENIMYITSEGVKYTVEFNDGDGIPYNKGDDNVGFVEGDDLKIMFFGKEYKVQDISDTKVELVEEDSEQLYFEGDQFTVQAGGETYTIEMGTALNDGDKFSMKLLDSTGSQLQQKTFEENEDVEFSNIEFDESVKVLEINDAENPDPHSVEVS